MRRLFAALALCFGLITSAHAESISVSGGNEDAGSGTVNNCGVVGGLGYYAATGATISCSTDITASNTALTLGSGVTLTLPDSSTWTSSGLAAVTATFTGTPATFTINTAANTTDSVSGSQTGPLYLKEAADLHAQGSLNSWNFFTTTLTPSANTANIWQNLSSYLYLSGSSTVTGEINLAHTYFQVNSGATASQAEGLETSALNNGTIGSYDHTLALFTNGASSTVTGSVYGSKYELVNNNSTSNSIVTYAVIDLEAMTGGGSLPEFYYLIRNQDTAASLNTLGGVAIGTNSPQAKATMLILGPDSSGSTFPFIVKNSATTTLFSISDSGAVGVPGTLAIGAGGAILSSATAATMQLGALDAASPVAQTLQAQSVVAGNANTAGATFTIGGSKSNGSGGGDVVLQTTLSSAASGSQNTLATALTLKGGTQHVAFGGGTPVVSACGTGSPAIDANATDTSGTVTTGSVATTCTVTFAKAYASYNHCQVSSQSSISGLAYSYTLSALTTTASVLGGDKFDYHCDGV